MALEADLTFLPEAEGVGDAEGGGGEADDLTGAAPGVLAGQYWPDVGQDREVAGDAHLRVQTQSDADLAVDGSVPHGVNDAAVEVRAGCETVAAEGIPHYIQMDVVEAERVATGEPSSGGVDGLVAEALVTEADDGVGREPLADVHVNGGVHRGHRPVVDDGVDTGSGRCEPVIDELTKVEGLLLCLCMCASCHPGRQCENDESFHFIRIVGPFRAVFTTEDSQKGVTDCRFNRRIPQRSHVYGVP